MTGRPALAVEQRKHREHGTRARYMFGEVGNDTANGCRCWECAQATNVYEKRRVAARRRGIEAFVDASEAAAHLRWLSANGLGQHRLAEVTGLSRSNIVAIKTGRRTRIRPETEQRVLACHLGMAGPGAPVPNRRVHEMVAELKAMGYAQQRLAQMLGYKGNSLQLRKSGRVTPAKAARIESLYLQITAERDAQRQWEAERQADYRQRKADGRLNYTRAAS
jgi:transcriptional regulator with XRE-family HTH domain